MPAGRRFFTVRQTSTDPGIDPLSDQHRPVRSLQDKFPTWPRLEQVFLPRRRRRRSFLIPRDVSGDSLVSVPPRSSLSPRRIRRAANCCMSHAQSAADDIGFHGDSRNAARDIPSQWTCPVQYTFHGGQRLIKMQNTDRVFVQITDYAVRDTPTQWTCQAASRRASARDKQHWEMCRSYCISWLIVGCFRCEGVSCAFSLEPYYMCLSLPAPNK